MSNPSSMLVTSEMMQAGAVPLLFTGGACNVPGADGPGRNPGRDFLARWLDHQGWSYFDPQIHPSTHGREYLWPIDRPQEVAAREKAKLRIYEITSTTISAISMLEIMDDARHGRTSIVWFNGGRSFAPIGLGDRERIRSDESLRKRLGRVAYEHLVAYVDAGTRLRGEVRLMLADCPHVVFVEGFDELTAAITRLLED